MIFVGIDYSINSPGVTIINEAGDTEYYFRFDEPKRKILELPASFTRSDKCIKTDQMDRYIDNADWVLKCIAGRDATVVIEGYALGASGGGRVFDLAENCGILKYKLREAGIKYITPTPGQIKKYYTGRGNAKKEFMVYSYIEKTGLDLHKIFGRETASSPLSDIADSHAMALYCKEHYEG